MAIIAYCHYREIVVLWRVGVVVVRRRAVAVGRVRLWVGPRGA